MDLDPREDSPGEMDIDRHDGSEDSDNESFKSAVDDLSEDLDSEASTPTALIARAYQIEMFEASLKKNIIVAMDTGSGKTQVAVLRIARELEQSDKRIWFLAPTVALVRQQHRVLQSQLPAVKIITLCGHDGVDTWSEKAVWDAVLLNVRLVVSTYQVLSDANAHGFVQLDSLSLIVIDEAHNCSGSHPISRLMTEGYLPEKKAGRPVPSILGLTASPLMSNNLDDVDKLEQVLDAVCRTPTKHREELIAHVNRPEMRLVSYGDSEDAGVEPAPTHLMTSFREAYHGLDIRKDPDVLFLKSQRTERAREKLRLAITKKDTPAQRALKDVYNRAVSVCGELGPWAADHYLSRAISLLSQQSRYIAEGALQSIRIPAVPEVPTQLTSKVLTLLQILASHQQDPVGIVFAQQRVMVGLLKHIVSTHPLTKDRYRVASMTGTATMPGQRNFKDMTSKEDAASLEGFREGRYNLLVATSVLEEGIDVPICNLVICFDEPLNIKSFIQRRGRARMGASTLYLMVQDASGQSATDWRGLERQMKEKYEDEMRQNTEAELVEDSRVVGYPVLENEKTGARLTLFDARSHLHHFCAKASSRTRHLQNEPYFIIRKVYPDPTSSNQRPLLKATVHLPGSISAGLRRHESLWTWTTEKFAIRDASFQAYKALYEAGLVNDHLLPLKASDFFADVGHDLGNILVRSQLDPWPEIVHTWQDGSFLYSRRLTVLVPGAEEPLEFQLILPVPVPYMAPLKLWWNSTSALTFITDREMREFRREEMTDDGLSLDHSFPLLAMAFQHRFPLTGREYPIRLVSTQRKLDVQDIAAREFDPQLFASLPQPPLVRNVLTKVPYFVTEVLSSKPPAELVLNPGSDYADLPENVPYVAYKSLGKAVGQLVPPSADHEPGNWTPRNGKLYQKVVPSTALRMDDFPAVFAQVGAVMPALTRAVETSLVAADLIHNRLGSLEIDDVPLIVTAITSPGPVATNYERLEFIGDTILKFCACLTASAIFPTYHERLLSQWKDSLVNNVRLCKASIDFGLDEYIIKHVASKKWRPKFVEDYLEEMKSPKPAETREMGSKMVADIVESLIGAAYTYGDMPKALQCIALLVPTAKSSNFKWQEVALSREQLFNLAPDNAILFEHLQPLETAMGYTFTKKSLLIEAMTHPSCSGLSNNDSCYERLEFLGDSILDVIVVKRLMAETGPNELAHYQMHEYLSSVVTADIMAFLSMEWIIKQTESHTIDPAKLEDMDLHANSRKSKITPANLISTKEDWPFWRFMRHNSNHVASAQEKTSKRHLALRNDILAAIWHENRMPWALLARMGPAKFYSDIVESLIGAVFIDSGEWDACIQVLTNMGLLPLLDHFLKTKAHVLHPNVELGILAPPNKRETRTEFVIISNKRGVIGQGTEFKDERGAVDDGLVGVPTEGEEGEKPPYDDGDVSLENEVFSCKLFVGGRQVADVEGAATKEEARVRAAEIAVALLKKERKVMEEMEAGKKAADVAVGNAAADGDGDNGDEDGEEEEWQEVEADVNDNGHDHDADGDTVMN
ncbi:P-loop containing nucleoside triphosphate hydrolase protein [Sordaria brevicollis]|uniref:P-loop containing nucleoside triphosphate hydrolase protein n=1 Tax=Sordaria brevicollis TaxID=83679 RepID=A0AAE0PCH5_SORBR|nr:P-loop containing nucleoside triphosphate hydrolase protein [Sordaria brevicollis]